MKEKKTATIKQRKYEINKRIRNKNKIQNGGKKRKSTKNNKRRKGKKSNR